jgi:hypothetical protein
MIGAVWSLDGELKIFWLGSNVRINPSSVAQTIESAANFQGDADFRYFQIAHACNDKPKQNWLYSVCRRINIDTPP